MWQCSIGSNLLARWSSDHYGCSNYYHRFELDNGSYLLSRHIHSRSESANWILHIILLKDISHKQAWNIGTSTTSDNIRFRLTNAAWNGAQTAGAKFVNMVGFNARYPSTMAKPTITLVSFNGVNVCSSSSPSTSYSTYCVFRKMLSLLFNQCQFSNYN